MSKFIEQLRTTAGITLVDDRVAHFGDPHAEFEAALAGATKCPLLSFGVLAISGTDAQAFVNAQFTTDCALLSPQQSQFSAWCDPKGRVLFLFTLYVDGSAVHAILPRTHIEAFKKRLQMYILRAEVQLEDITDKITVLGITGELDETSSAEPAWATRHPAAEITAVRHGQGSRFMLAVATSAATNCWDAIDRPPIGEDAWTALDCLNGIPRLAESAQGQYLPQQLNLDALNALSFSKGCYPGQEIIARLKYRGEVKRRLVAATIDSSLDLAPGLAIRAGDEDRSIGKVLLAQVLGDNKTAISAVVDVKQSGSSLFVEALPNTPLHRQPLPYAVEL